MILTEKNLWLKFSIALTLFSAGVLGLTGYSLYFLRTEAINSNFNIATLLVRSFENLITQSLDATILASYNTIPSDVKKLNVPHIEADLLLILRSAPYIRSLSLLDTSNRIIASSNRANVGLTVATDSYFPQADPGQKVLRIGTPWVGRDFSHGQVSTDRAALDEDSTFIPVVQHLRVTDSHLTLLIAVNPDFFLNHMLHQLKAEVGSVEVLRLDGTPLLMTPSGIMTGKEDFRKLRPDERESGIFEYDSGHGKQALSAFQVSRLYPFVVVTHLSRDVALKRWVKEMKTIVVVVLPTLIALGIVAAAFCRRQLLLDAQRTESDRLQRVNAACVFTNTREGIIISDAHDIIMDVNDAFTHITGYSRDEALGKSTAFFSSGHHDQEFFDTMWSELRVKGHWDGEIWNRNKNGEVFAEKLTISAVPDSQGIVQQYVSVFSNITATKNYQSELEFMANYDALTNLPNRLLLADRLSQAMTHLQRREQWLGVVFIDLDGFKAINDTYGHDAGDNMLMAVSERMREVLRDGDTLSRKGGDEFVAVLVDLPDTLDALPLLDRLLTAAARPFQFRELRLNVTASIGISYYCHGEVKTVEELLREADMAMYQAKSAGKNQYHVYCALETNDNV